MDKQAMQKSAHDHHARSRQWIVGDRVMAHNLCPGPNWVPSTVMEVLRPVTFIVETEAGFRWKRHTDQLKDWLPSVPSASSESSSEEAYEPVTEDFTPTDPSESAESESNETPEPIVEDPETPEPSSPKPAEPRYPRRNHQAPVRY